MEFPVGVFTPLTLFLKIPLYISIPVYYKLQKRALEPFYIRFTFMYAYIAIYVYTPVLVIRMACDLAMRDHPYLRL
jgi:hypothetical protein